MRKRIAAATTGIVITDSACHNGKEVSVRLAAFLLLKTVPFKAVLCEN